MSSYDCLCTPCERLRDSDKKRQKMRCKKMSMFHLIYQATTMQSPKTFFSVKGNNMGYQKVLHI